VGSQKEAFAEIPGANPKMAFERLTELLREHKVLPKKREGLEGNLKSWFKEFSAEERNKLVERLFKDGFVKETEKKELVFVMAKVRG
jgi:hypothetical protein